MCPETTPFVYYDGQYCCPVKREKWYSRQGEKCDSSELQRDSLCCDDVNLMVKNQMCPSGICDDFQGTMFCYHSNTQCPILCIV